MSKWTPKTKKNDDSTWVRLTNQLAHSAISLIRQLGPTKEVFPMLRESVASELAGDSDKMKMTRMLAGLASSAEKLPDNSIERHCIAAITHGIVSEHSMHIDTDGLAEPEDISLKKLLSTTKSNKRSRTHFERLMRGETLEQTPDEAKRVKSKK